MARNQSKGTTKLRSELSASLRQLAPSNAIVDNIARSKGANGYPDEGKSYLSKLSPNELAKAYEQTMAQWNILNENANRNDKENPDSHGDGSYDSVSRLSAEGYLNNVYAIEKELSARFLNKDGNPFWLKDREEKSDARVWGENYHSASPSRKLELLLENNKDLSKVNDNILNKSLDIANKGLAGANRKNEGAKYQQNVIVPIQNEIQKRKNSK